MNTNANANANANTNTKAETETAPHEGALFDLQLFASPVSDDILAETYPPQWPCSCGGSDLFASDSLFMVDNSLLTAEIKTLSEESTGLRAVCGKFRDENRSLKRENAVLKEEARTLQLEVKRLKAAKDTAPKTSQNPIDPEVRFAIGGYDFTARIHPEIYFACNGSRIGIYPANSGTTAFRQFDITGHDNGIPASNEPVKFVGTLHSIVEARSSRPSAQ